jgi:hypothetical protein
LEVVLAKKPVVLEIEGRKIFIHSQQTQTIKVCTKNNTQGEYEKYYRIPTVLSDKDINTQVSKGISTLKDLDFFCENTLSGKREQKNEFKQNNFKSGYDPKHDTGLLGIINAVENSIDVFIDEFIKLPYLHRKEHSIHMQLFYIMMKNPLLYKSYIMGDNKTKTLLVHKEWPWPKDTKRKGKRATFDFAVLTPEYLQRACTTIKDFSKGYSCPPIIIEIGLDYGLKHLQDDNKKLSDDLKSGFNGYLIHLERRGNTKSDIEKIIENPVQPSKGGVIKAAYALVINQKRYKHINDKSIAVIP